LFLTTCTGRNTGCSGEDARNKFVLLGWLAKVELRDGWIVAAIALGGGGVERGALSAEGEGQAGAILMIFALQWL
jgi:hypothetical protein